jgi:hypothetical protein
MERLLPVPAHLDIQNWGAVNGVESLDNQHGSLDPEKTNVLNADGGQAIGCP